MANHVSDATQNGTANQPDQPLWHINAPDGNACCHCCQQQGPGQQPVRHINAPENGTANKPEEPVWHIDAPHCKATCPQHGCEQQGPGQPPITGCSSCRRHDAVDNGTAGAPECCNGALVLRSGVDTPVNMPERDEDGDVIMGCPNSGLPALPCYHADCSGNAAAAADPSAPDSGAAQAPMRSEEVTTMTSMAPDGTVTITVTKKLQIRG